MDQLSQNGEAFVFIVNFLQQECQIFTIDQLQNSTELQVQFENFSTKRSSYTLNKKPAIKVFPEDFETYKKGFDNVMQNIKLGNSYLVNYTRKNKIETDLTLQEVFDFSQAKYKVLYKDNWVCFSPETFVTINNQRIATFPMKGTIDAEIPDAKNILLQDKKEKAEHYTVVDLLRNDLSRVADDVKLVDFQRIDYLQTQKKNLYAMSSEIEGIVKPEYQKKIGSLLQQLLPAGSILGAPKDKTLEIILQSEAYDRGYYTGICGYYDGQNLDTGVMIRFIERKENQLYFKSGGGITHQSDAKAEYEEVINKIYVPIY